MTKDDFKTTLAKTAIKSIIKYALRPDLAKKTRRKNFSKRTRLLIKLLQNFDCNDCGKYNKFLEFHHKNGNRSDNRLENCEALCPNCHRKRHRKKKRY